MEATIIPFWASKGMVITASFVDEGNEAGSKRHGEILAEADHLSISNV